MHFFAVPAESSLTKRQGKSFKYSRQILYHGTVPILYVSFIIEKTFVETSNADLGKKNDKCGKPKANMELSQTPLNTDIKCVTGFM